MQQFIRQISIYRLTSESNNSDVIDISRLIDDRFSNFKIIDVNPIVISYFISDMPAMIYNKSFGIILIDYYLIFEHFLLKLKHNYTHNQIKLLMEYALKIKYQLPIDMLCIEKDMITRYNNLRDKYDTPKHI